MKSFEKEKILNESLLKVLPNFVGVFKKYDGEIEFEPYSKCDVSKFNVIMSLMVYIENELINENNKFTIEQLVQISLQMLSIAHACQKKGDN